jgi:hypothetical protein
LPDPIIASVSSLSLEIPADPQWLHVARSVVLTAVGVSDLAPGDFDAFALAVGEALLELSTTPGVTTISATLDSVSGGSGVELVGRGESIATDGPSPLLQLILGAGARGFTIETGESQYSFTLPLGTRQP